MRRKGFSLVELLVVITIILVLMGLMGAALSNARGNQKKQGTQTLIGKLDAVLTAQFTSYAGRDIDAPSSEARAAELRRLVTGDMPDRWIDVKYMADNPSRFTSRHQRIYIEVWKSMNPPPAQNAFETHPRRDDYAGAECLFMVVMRGGIADCLNCSDLANGRIGDKDGDGAFEFWDEWGNPIGYILWPGGLRLPAGSEQPFFGPTPAFLANGTGRSIRPLVYSAGPDGKDLAQSLGDFGFLTGTKDSGNLAAGMNCGDHRTAPASQFASPIDGVADNVTNLDMEAK